MKKLLVCAIILLFCTSAFAQGTKWFSGTFDEAKTAAAKEGKLLLVHFYSPN